MISTFGDEKLYTHDEFNRQKTAYARGMVLSYTYRPDGLRYSKAIDGATVTTHIWDGQNMAAELSGTSVKANYLRGANLLASEDSAGTRSYYLYNAHGDVVQLANAAGAVAKSYDYDAFGNEKGTPDAADSNPFRYCGEYTDAETGTIYLRARYYDPTVGRFTQKDTHWNTKNMIYGDNPLKLNENEDDPLGLNAYTYVPNTAAIMQSGNLYVYCMDNPLMYVDENGQWVHIAFGAGIGFFAGGIISAATQYATTGEIDWGQTLISAGSGALSGALGSTGVGRVGQIAMNTALGAATGFGDQLYVNKGDIAKINITDVMASALLGGVSGAFGGAGGGSKHLDALSNQLFSRVGNAVQYQSGAALKKEISNAVVYYLKNSTKQNAAIKNNIVKSYIPTAVKGGLDWIDGLFNANIQYQN